MAPKFKVSQTVTVDDVNVEIGRRSNRLTFRITTGSGALFLVSEDTANAMADALDEAIDLVESDPLLWEGGSV